MRMWTLLLIPSFFFGPRKALGTSDTEASLAPQPTVCGDVLGKAGNNSDLTATEALACLVSVPFNAAVASRFVKHYNETLQFHSTLAYLKHPPEGYQQPPVDLVRELGIIQGRIDSQEYRNQYQFEADVQRLVNSAHDSHLALNGGILSAFRFSSPKAIVSFSATAHELPRLYLGDDAEASYRSQATSSPWRASPIETINGKTAEEFLTTFIALHSSGNLDRHADWNAFMDSPAQTIQDDTEDFRNLVLYPGDEMTVVLENGTTLPPEPFQAIYSDQWPTGPLATGGDFYNFFVLGLYPAGFYEEHIEPYLDNETEITASTIPETEDDTSAAQELLGWSKYSERWPKADFLQDDFGPGNGALISGYFLNGTEIAVLSIPSFRAQGYATSTFSQAISDFLALCHEHEKSRLVIDLQRNDGGSLTLAVDTFKHFFPDIDPYMATRMRAHTAANELGRIMTTYWENLDPENDDEVFDYFVLASNDWVAANRIDPHTDQYFPTWQDFYGPEWLKQDNFTKLQRYNFSDPWFVTDSMSFPESIYIVKGEPGNTANSSNTLSPMNITILTDGLCGSACALFAEMMHHEGQVDTIVVGGLPVPGPMQATGATRGASGYSLENLDRDIDWGNRIASRTKQSITLPERENNDFYIVSGVLNLRDGIRKNEEAPLQFLYDPAACRIYHTQDTVFNQTALWRYAAEVMWSNKSLCVANSTNNPSPPKRTIVPISDQDDPYLNAPLSDELLDGLTEINSGGIQAGKSPSRISHPLVGHACVREGQLDAYPAHFGCVKVSCGRKNNLHVLAPRCSQGDYCRGSGNCNKKDPTRGLKSQGYCEPDKTNICGTRTGGGRSKRSVRYD